MRSATASEFGLDSFGVPPPMDADGPRPLAREAFRGLLGEIVLSNDPFTESDPAAVLVQLYVLFGNCIGRSPHCYADSVRHGVNENVLVIGPTGDGRKGTGYANARQFVVTADSEWAQKRIMGGLSSGEGLVHQVRDPGEEDLGVLDKRLCVVETEFGAVLKVMARKGSTVSELIRQAFDSQGLNILSRNNPAKSTNPHVSIIAHTTPSDLRRYLDDVDVGNGFLNRFLLVYSKRSKLLPQGGEMPRDRFFTLTAGVADAIAFARRVELMPRDEAARQLWDEIYGDLCSAHPGVYGALVSRGAAHVTRLSMIAALADKGYFVRREHLETALAIWEYCQGSVKFVFGDNLGDRVSDTLLAALRKNPSGLTLTQISVEVFKRNESAASIERALHGLENLHLAKHDGRTWFAADPRRHC